METVGLPVAAAEATAAADNDTCTRMLPLADVMEAAAPPKLMDSEITPVAETEATAAPVSARAEPLGSSAASGSAARGE